MYNDLCNQRFGKLLVIKRIGSKVYPKIKGDPSKSSHHALWLCLCDCGCFTEAITSKLKNGNKVSCGCHRLSNILNRSGQNHQCWEGYKDISKTFWSSIKRGAVNRKIDFNVSIEYIWNLWILQEGKCAITNQTLSLKKSRTNKKDQTASLDRIDSSKGYVEGNVQWVHKDINQMKWNFSQDYFIQLCKLVVENQL